MSCAAFSLALDERIDISDTALLVICHVMCHVSQTYVTQPYLSYSSGQLLLALMLLESF